MLASNTLTRLQVRRGLVTGLVGLTAASLSFSGVSSAQTPYEAERNRLRAQGHSIGYGSQPRLPETWTIVALQFPSFPDVRTVEAVRITSTPAGRQQFVTDSARCPQLLSAVRGLSSLDAPDLAAALTSGSVSVRHPAGGERYDVWSSVALQDDGSVVDAQYSGTRGEVVDGVRSLDNAIRVCWRPVDR